MQVTWIENNLISAPQARTYRDRNMKLHFRVSIGDASNLRTWEYRIPILDNSCRAPIDDNEIITLSEHYKLIPVLSEKYKEHVKDKRGYYLYYLVKDHNINDKDMLLFLNIPGEYRELRTIFSGGIRKLGKGSKGKIRGGEFFSTHSYALELTSDATIVWFGKKEDGTVVEQKIKYIYMEKRFELSPIKEKL